MVEGKKEKFPSTTKKEELGLSKCHSMCIYYQVLHFTLDVSEMEFLFKKPPEQMVRLTLGRREMFFIVNENNLCRLDKDTRGVYIDPK